MIFLEAAQVKTFVTAVVQRTVCNVTVAVCSDKATVPLTLQGSQVCS